ncbi:MAG: hypothetical protein ACXVP1_02150, partial [Thermoleophilia bacterium]
WLFCAASLATLLLHLFAVLSPLSVLAASLVLEPQMSRDRWHVLAPPVALLLATTLAVAYLGAGQRGQIAWIPTPFGGAQLMRALEGPAAGRQVTYGVLVLAAALAGAAVCLWERRDGSRRVAPDLRLLGVMLAWAVLPTAMLVAGSLVRPLFLDRYVTASVPGLALVIALLVAGAAERVAVGSPAPRRVFLAVVLGRGCDPVRGLLDPSRPTDLRGGDLRALVRR